MTTYASLKGKYGRRYFWTPTLACVLLLALGGGLIMSGTANPDPTTHTVAQNQYKGAIQGNETHQFQVRNRFQFQIRANASMDMDFDIDVDSVGDRQFQLELNTSASQCLRVRINSSNEATGLRHGAQMIQKGQGGAQAGKGGGQTEETPAYKFQEKFMLNISLNGTGPVQARLHLATGDGNAQWAYYDEAKGEFTLATCTYQNGILSADTDHFSIWTVLAPDGGFSIAGYDLMGVWLAVSMAGMVGFFLIRHSHRFTSASQ